MLFLKTFLRLGLVCVAVAGRIGSPSWPAHAQHFTPRSRPRQTLTCMSHSRAGTSRDDHPVKWTRAEIAMCRLHSRQRQPNVQFAHNCYLETEKGASFAYFTN